MSAILNALYSTWNQVSYALSNIRLFDIIDILAVAFIIYKLICFARESRAGQLVKGIVIILVLYVLSNWLSMPVLRWILGVVVNSSLVVLVIIFHPEIRHMLERVGSSNLGKGLKFGQEINKRAACIESICKAAGQMQDSKIGALIVFERKIFLDEIIESGTVIDAAPSISVVNNIFFPKSPLHDGAVIVRNDRIYAAGCFLPLTQNKDVSSALGTRHRAAIGISEESDAIVLVVSEETGNISIVSGGNITRNYSAASATLELKKLLIDSEIETKDSGFFGKIKNLKIFNRNKKDSEVKSDEK